MTNTGFKTQNQIEFAEWFELIKKIGYKQADVARELHISRAAVTNFLSAKRNPSPRTLADIRGFAERLKAAKAVGEEIERKFGNVDRLKEQLEDLEKKHPPSFEAARATIDALHRGINSKPLSEHEERGLSAASEAKRLARGSMPKRKVVSPIENKPDPKPGAGESSK